LGTGRHPSGVFTHDPAETAGADRTDHNAALGVAWHGHLGRGLQIQLANKKFDRIMVRCGHHAPHSSIVIPNIVAYRLSRSWVVRVSSRTASAAALIC